MTVRVCVARSVTRNLKTLGLETLEGATLTGYGILVALAWLVLAGQLH